MKGLILTWKTHENTPVENTEIANNAIEATGGQSRGILRGSLPRALFP
jgi:hypothetical protein